MNNHLIPNMSIQKPTKKQNLISIWPSIRNILREFTFYGIKDIITAAGLDIHELAHLQQKPGSSVSKGMLIDEIERLLFKHDIETQNRIIKYCVVEILRSPIPEYRERLEELLLRVGWGISGNEPYPIKLQLDIEIEKLPEPVQTNIQKAIRRYRDGDISGAVTAICGAVDELTERMYLAHPELGDHRNDSYHKRISKSYRLAEVPFKNILKKVGFCDNDIRLMWDNQKKAVSQAGYVLGSYRRNISDAHGDQKVLAEVAQPVLDNAIFIIRSLSAYMLSSIK
jgi:hypothetical protein